MLKVERIEQIRRAYYIEKKSIRQIAKEMGHSRDTVSRAIDSSEPRQYRLSKPRRCAKLGPYKVQIDELLVENEKLPRKQKYTWKKIYEAIKAKGYEGGESTLRHYLSKTGWKKKKVAVYLPLEFDPGTDGQVDWGEGEVIMGGEQITVQLFLMWLNYSRRVFVMAFPNQKQEAFFLGHVRAFEHFGGVPGRLTYDNLKAAVYRVLTGKNREEQESFIRFRSHYLYESHYCTPGMGHQKGGVEHSVGYARRNFLVPLPQVGSFTELNEHLLAECLKNDQRQVEGQSMTIAEAWGQEQSYLRPLPAQAYPCCRTLTVSLNPYSQVVVDTNRYSVPTDQAASELVVKIYPFQVEVYRPGEKKPIANHARSYGHKQDIFDPLHYLPLLQIRPGALAHAKPIRQWRQQWPVVYETLLTKLETQWPDGRGIREFIRVLRFHEKHPADLIEKAVEQALNYGCVHADGVLLCLRQLSQTEPLPDRLDLSRHPQLQNIGNQAPNLEHYNQLLGGSSCP
jgi:transposase